jgi:hypothetical protein
VQLERRPEWEFEFQAPDPGHHYYTVLATVQNGSGAQITVNPLDFQLEYGGSVRVDREGGYREPALGLTNLVPQQAISGWLVFQVPDGVSVTGIHWSPEFDVTLKIEASDIP